MIFGHQYDPIKIQLGAAASARMHTVLNIVQAHVENTETNKKNPLELTLKAIPSSYKKRMLKKLEEQ